MDYFRRKMLIGAIAAIAATKVKASKLVKASKSETKDQLIVDQNNILSPGETYSLPQNPKIGTKFTLVIDQNCMHHYPKIAYNSCQILGAHEDLVLDTMAIFQLTYEGPETGWVLS